MKLAEALRTREVVVCVGSGGVGKTTVAATLALRAAVEGRKVMVLTIDPARRLANALGLPELGNVRTCVPPETLADAGLDARGELWAMMLDLKRAWDDFILRTVPAEAAEGILRNRFYQTLSSALAGSQEYIAMEKLAELHSSGEYDLIVLDTPPTAHALDFLDAPDRILDFLDNEAARVILGPALRAGRGALKIFNFGSSVVAKGLARFTGGETLTELAAFMNEIQGTYDVFKDRAAAVKRLLGSDRTAFVLVGTPHATTVDEAIHFHGLLVEERMPIVAAIANRVHDDPLDEFDTPSPELLADELARAKIEDGGSPPLSQRLHRAVREARALAEHDRTQIARLKAAIDPTPLVAVPRFPSDVYDLPSLDVLGRHLLA